MVLTGSKCLEFLAPWFSFKSAVRVQSTQHYKDISFFKDGINRGVTPHRGTKMGEEHHSSFSSVK